MVKDEEHSPDHAEDLGQTSLELVTTFVKGPEKR